MPETSTHFTMPDDARLKNTIHSFWQSERVVDFQHEIIIPKGVVEIIFNFSVDSVTSGGLQHERMSLPRCFINGFNTRPIKLHFSSHQAFFGIRLHPIAVRNIFGMNAGEFANVSVDLTLVDDTINSLWHQLVEQLSFKQRVTVFSKWIFRKGIVATAQELLINDFLNDTSEVIPSVTDLSKQFCYSPRHVSRKLFALSGMNAEELLAYKKYMLAVRLIHADKLSLTQIAYCCQFTDQSHFIKTFKSLALMTPGSYRKYKSALAGHIYDVPVIEQLPRF